ncbi:unnamed protein product, partial [Ranitomeya imitator]
MQQLPFAWNNFLFQDLQGCLLRHSGILGPIEFLMCKDFHPKPTGPDLLDRVLWVVVQDQLSALLRLVLWLQSPLTCLYPLDLQHLQARLPIEQLLPPMKSEGCRMERVKFRLENVNMQSVPSESRTLELPIGAKDSRLQDQRQISPTGGRERIKQSDSSTFSKPENKVVSPMASEQRKQLDDLKKFKNDFRLQSNPSPDAIDQLLSKNRENLDKPRELLKEKSDSNSKESASESGSNAPTSNSSSKPSSPSISPSISSSGSEHKRGPEVTSQGVQTSGPGKQDREDKDDKKENASEQVRKSTLNPNAKEFNPRSYAQPKPSTTPTSPRPQAQPSPSMVGHQQPTPVYTQPVCFAPNMMYPVPPLYPIPMTTVPVNQAKTYRAGKVPNMPQQRQDQHHQNTMMHPVSAAGPPIVATSPAYSAQYVTYNPQQFPSQPLMQHVQHYQSQHPHVYSPVIQGNSRMMAPPAHAQPGLVSSAATQYGAPEQTHAMY